MIIYLLRHGDALQNYESDKMRPLSENGIKDVKKIGSFLESKKFNIQKIFSSPLFRAYQTAELIGKIIGFQDEIEELDILLPEANLDDLLNFLLKNDYVSVLLVSHQPLIGNIISKLISSRTVQVEVKKSSLACIEIKQPINTGDGVLKFLINSELI